MVTLRKLARRLRALLRGRRLETELDDEIRFHLEMEADQLRAGGVDPAEARRRARLAFGGVERFREETRDARGLRGLEDLTRDLSHGIRTLRRRPGFALVVLLTLGVGVGGSAAIYGAVDGILLTPLPYPDADRIFGLWQHDRRQGIEREEVAPANFLDWRDRSRSFAAITAMEPYGLDWLREEGPVYLSTWLVYERFFEVLGTAPLLGRTFRPDEHVAGRSDVVVLGHRVWREHFGGDPGVIGRVVTLDRKPTTIVGVMPEGFAPQGDDVVWAPEVIGEWERRARLATFYLVLGRLRDGVGPDEARAELDGIARQLGQEHPTTNRASGITMVPIAEQIVGGARRALLLLLGAVGLVLLVVVANVASLQLARAAAREREFAVRGALGAGRGRLGRQLAVENLLLAVLGAGVGFAVARVALGAIRGLAPGDFPRLEQLRADGEVLGFALGVSLLATLATGILPAALATRFGTRAAVVEGSRGSTGGRVTRVQGVLVVLQVALSLVLLVAAGLLTRSFLAVLGEGRGFRTDGVVTATAQSWTYYPTPAARVNFVREVVERLGATPGVTAAGMASAIPLMTTIGAEQAPLRIEGAPAPGPDEAPPNVQYAVVTPGYFAALGIPLLAGRGFDARDEAESAPVVVVSRSFVRRHFGTDEPLGKRIAVGSPGGRTPVRMAEVVGVVGDIRRSALNREGEPTAYFPHPQNPTGANAFVVHGAGDPARLLEAIRRAVWAVHPEIPLTNVATMADLVGASVRDRSFLLAVLGGFAAMALGLAAAGLFGLMSFATGQRTREIGIRIAFGAEGGRIVRSVLGRGAALAGAGIGLGLVGSVAATRLLGSMLYRVAPLDPVTFGAGAVVLLVTALGASWYPAWRAAGTDPVRALAGE